MTHTVETVHVAWGESRAESVREALRLEGDGARVIALRGRLSLGPLDPSDPEARRAWFAANTRMHDEPREAEPDREAAWREATASGIHPVYWVCLSDAGEHACFLAFAARMNGRPFDVIDATGLDLTRLGGIASVWSLGLLRPEEIVGSRLPARRRAFSAVERATAAAEWARLSRENAPLRVVADGRLISAPLTHYDAVLTGQAMPDGEPVARLIGRVLHHLSGLDPPGQGCADELLFGRILALGEAGALVVGGPGPGMRDHTVRRPGAPGSADG